MTIAAREFAIQKHGSQMYGQHPYVYHLDQVAEKVGEMFRHGSRSNKDTLNKVAYLHDVLEDTDTVHQELEELYGTTVADAVLLLTKCSGLSYEHYISKLKKNYYALSVKIADTRCNLKQSILDNDKNRTVKYAKQLVLLEE